MDEIDRFLNAPNYYAALGLNRKKFTPDQVDKAYKKYALKFHPDKNNNPKATQAFTKLTEIKETLKDSSRRNFYDNLTFHSKVSPNLGQSSNKFYEPANNYSGRTNNMKKQTLRKRKSKIMPLCSLLILLALFSFVANTEPFSNSISKESLKKIIIFSMESNNIFDFSIYYSKVFQQKFYIPKEWERNNIMASDDPNDSESLREQIRIYADEIYKEKLISDCEKEKKSSSYSCPSCVLLEEIK